MSARVEAVAYNVPDASVTEAGLYRIPEDLGEREALVRLIVADTVRSDLSGPTGDR